MSFTGGNYSLFCWFSRTVSGWLCMYVLKVKLMFESLYILYSMYIKTHDSESRGQEEAGRTRRMSVLFTGNTAVKLVNALNKPP